MNFLILYSSTEGHTRKIADFLAQELRGKDFQADLLKVSNLCPAADHYDSIIVAGSIHAGQYSSELVDYISANAAQLNSVPTAFYSVGLSITNKDPEARRSLEETTASFLRTTGWNPLVTEQVAGALLYSQYGFIKKMLIRSIMKKSGGDTDTSRDYIYTDWGALKQSIHSFARRVELVPH